MRLIDVDALIDKCNSVTMKDVHPAWRRFSPETQMALEKHGHAFKRFILEMHTVDAVPVVRCKDCKHAEILERNCELSRGCYMHCNLWRGDETRNVWHKYKKYYRDYSIVELDGYCSEGERRSGDAER